MARRNNIETQNLEETNITEFNYNTSLGNQPENIKEENTEFNKHIENFINENPLPEIRKETSIVTESTKPAGDKKMSTNENKTKKTILGMLRSANAHPTQYIYKGETAFIPPNGRIPNVDKSLLKMPLPDGVKFVVTPDTRKD